MSDLTSGSAAGSSLDFQTPLEEPSTQLLIKQGSWVMPSNYRKITWVCNLQDQGLMKCHRFLGDET